MHCPQVLSVRCGLGAFVCFGLRPEVLFFSNHLYIGQLIILEIGHGKNVSKRNFVPSSVILNMLFTHFNFEICEIIYFERMKILLFYF